ncbi:hypothetical protein TQ29_16665 [Actibacterium sp. EMB200-NS6]|nr:hypothetical protein TQ29_16665 [Actibacterium sp. EMB200-NS6]
MPDGSSVTCREAVSPGSIVGGPVSVPAITTLCALASAAASSAVTPAASPTSASASTAALAEVPRLNASYEPSWKAANSGVIEKPPEAAVLVTEISSVVAKAGAPNAAPVNARAPNAPARRGMCWNMVFSNSL